MISGFFRKDLLEKIENLESRISGLEKENEKLRKRLSKREEKKESDPAKFQETAEELKRAKASIEALEERINALTGDEAEDENSRAAQNIYLSQKQSLELLGKLSSLKSSRKSLVSVYLLPGNLEQLKEAAGDEIAGIIEGIKSETGIIGFFDADIPSICGFFAAPPFPPEKTAIIKDSRFSTSAAEDIFTKQRHCVFILAHAGESCIGIATESGLIKSDLIKSSVKEKHSKGGWSQKRFERLREEDIRHHIEKAGEYLEELLCEYENIADEIVIAGDKKTGLEIFETAGRKDIPVIYRQLEAKPDRYAGERVAKELWSARWYRN